MKAKLTTWLIDERAAGAQSPRITADIIAMVRDRRALHYSERIDRLVKAIATGPGGPFQQFRTSGVVDEKYHAAHEFLALPLETETTDQTQHYVRRITTDGFLQENGSRYELSGQGLRRAEELDKRGEGLRAFVAMWFDDSLSQAYIEMEKGISAAGYQAIRIDRKEHNNKIDDEIVAEIRRSRFVVADFTSGLTPEGEAIARGGVYFEAGFAMGLGIPVIWMCREDMIAKVHFDTRQYSHIAWSKTEDIAKRLYDRIAATIGEASSAPGLR